MPFDAIPPDIRKVPDRTTALRDLAWLLRNPHRWPAGFKWDYWYEDSCAIGLCRRYYGAEVYDVIARNRKAAWQILYGKTTRTSPNDIAKSIDRYLDKKPKQNGDQRQLQLAL